MTLYYIYIYICITNTNNNHNNNNNAIYLIIIDGGQLGFGLALAEPASICYTILYL